MRISLFYSLALVLVVAYVNTLVVWREIGNIFGWGIRDGMPFIVVGVLVLAIAVYVAIRAHRGTLSIA